MRIAFAAVACVAGLGLMSSSGAFAQALVQYQVVGKTIPQPLTGVPGDPEKGKRVVTNPTNATCLICHSMPLPEELDPGNLAPNLAGVGSRYTAAELRLRLVNPKLITPDTIMPAYYRIEGLHRVEAQYVGKTVYSPQDIEDAIAYLLTIK